MRVSDGIALTTLQVHECSSLSTWSGYALDVLNKMGVMLISDYFLFLCA